MKPSLPLAIFLGSLAAMMALSASATACFCTLAALLFCRFGGTGGAREDGSTGQDTLFHPIANPVTSGRSRGRPEAGAEYQQAFASRGGEEDGLEMDDEDWYEESEINPEGVLRLEDGSSETPPRDDDRVCGVVPLGSHLSKDEDIVRSVDTPSALVEEDIDDTGAESWSLFGSCDEGALMAEDEAALDAFDEGFTFCETGATGGRGHGESHGQADEGKGHDDRCQSSAEGLRRRAVGKIN